ncbi:MAG: hypothetical protein ABII71_04985 [Candidatus Micrarchaeota archaeon]
MNRLFAALLLLLLLFGCMQGLRNADDSPKKARGIWVEEIRDY